MKRFLTARIQKPVGGHHDYMGLHVRDGTINSLSITGEAGAATL